MFDALHHPIRAGLDILAIFVTVGALFQYLPTISAILGVIWYLICLYEYFKGTWHK